MHSLHTKWSRDFDLGAGIRTLALSIMVITVPSVAYFSNLGPRRLGYNAPKINHLTGTNILQHIMVFCLRNYL